MRKKVLSLLFLSLLACGGGTACTTSGIAGFAREEYVLETFDESQARQEAELKEIRDKLSELNREIADMRIFLEEFEDLAKIQEMANDVEARLEQMPEETLLKLFEILKAYLGK